MEVFMPARSGIADAKFIGGYNCAQSVLFSFCDKTNLSPDLALKLACGFGAGMGRKGEVCGAVTGGILALGAMFGRGDKEGRQATELAYAKVKELLTRFSSIHGSCICSELLSGCDLTTLRGQNHFRDTECFDNICRRCVRDAVEIVEALM